MQDKGVLLHCNIILPYSHVQWKISVTLLCCYSLFLLIHQRPAEIVDEEEDGEKASKDTGKKEELIGMNGDVEEEGDGEALAASKQAEEIPDPGEEQAGPARVNGVTDEENGEELDQVNNELQEAVDEEIKSPGAGSGQEEVFLLPLLTCLPA